MFGTTQCKGPPPARAPWLEVPSGSPPRRSQAAAAAAHRQRPPAATSAVSAGCTTLPAAKIPAALVEPSASQAGPRVPGSIERPARRASSLSGTKSPVNTTVSTATVRSWLPGPADDHAVHLLPPVHAGHRRLGPDRHPEADPDEEVEEAIRLWLREVGDESHRAHAGVPQGQHGRVGDVLGTHDEGPPAHGQVLAVDPLLELAGGEDPRGPRPGDQAGRPRTLPGSGRQHDRSRVASRALRPDPSPRRRPGAAHPVTMVRVRMSTPPATARSTQRRAYAGPLRTRRRSRMPKPVCSHRRGVPPASSSRSTTTTFSVPPALQRSGRRQAGRARTDDQRVDHRRRSGSPPSPRTSIGPRPPLRRRSPDNARWSPGCDGAHRRGPPPGPES